MYDDNEDGFDSPSDMLDDDQQVIDTNKRRIIPSGKNGTLLSSKTTYVSMSGWFWFVLIILALIVVYAMSTGEILVGLFWSCVLLWWVFKPDHARGVRTTKKEFLFEHYPCPRCANLNVQIYDESYFACGFCGARGYYPFVTPAMREQRCSGNLFYVRKSKTKEIV